MQLYNTVLATTFGRGGDAPLKTAYLRLLGLASASIGISWALAQSISNVPLQTVAEPARLVFGAALLVQLVVLFALLTTQGTVLAGRDTFARLLLVWPVTSWQRLGALFLPGALLGVLALLLVAWPLGVLFMGLGLNPGLLGVAAVLGGISAFGIVYGLPALLWLKLLYVPAVLWGEYALVKIIQDTQLAAAERLAAVGIISLGWVVLGVLAITAGRRLEQRLRLTPQSRVVRTAWLPAAWWHGKQVLRTAYLRLDVATATGISVGIAVVAARQHFNDAQTLILLASVLAASLSAGFRGLTRRHNPFAIAGLRGVCAFVGTQFVWALALCTVVTLPLLAVARQFDMQIVFGCAAGLLAGYLVVPSARDITGHFLATLLALGLLLVVPQLVPTVGANPYYIAVLTAALLGLSVFAEYKRNPYIWRKRA